MTPPLTEATCLIFNPSPVVLEGEKVQSQSKDESGQKRIFLWRLQNKGNALCRECVILVPGLLYYLGSVAVLFYLIIVLSSLHPVVQCPVHISFYIILILCYYVTAYPSYRCRSTYTLYCLFCLLQSDNERYYPQMIESALNELDKHISCRNK